MKNIHFAKYRKFNRVATTFDLARLLLPREPVGSNQGRSRWFTHTRLDDELIIAGTNQSIRFPQISGIRRGGHKGTRSINARQINNPRPIKRTIAQESTADAPSPPFQAINHLRINPSNWYGGI